jgi:hypothetical protein
MDRSSQACFKLLSWHMEGLRKSQKLLSVDRWSMSQDSNQWSPEYEAGVVTPTPSHSIPKD